MKRDWSAATSAVRHTIASVRGYASARASQVIAVLISALVFVTFASALDPSTDVIVLGRSSITLNGPWRFHTGDNPIWADPQFDDSGWESVDLTAAAGAHDNDVGLTGFVPGWSARGHRGYAGYGWYRLRIAVSAPAGQQLQISGSAAVDSAYQVFLNGHLLGEAGRFSGRVPEAFSIQPRVFEIPSSVSHEEQPLHMLLAFRVWMGPWDIGDPEAGGIHIAPALGTSSAIACRDQTQWLQTIKGYVVEVAEALAFVLLAIIVLVRGAFDSCKAKYIWMSIALLLTALARANQAVFFWGQFETVPMFELISIVLLFPLCLPAWIMAWYMWCARPRRRWSVSIAVLTLLYVASEFLGRSWFYGAIQQSISSTLELSITAVRLVFLSTAVFLLYEVFRNRKRSIFLLFPAAFLIFVGQFAQELSVAGIKGIWFPFGTGVSRTQFAYAAFDVIFLVFLASEFLRLAGYQRQIQCLPSNRG